MRLTQGMTVYRAKIGWGAGAVEMHSATVKSSGDVEVRLDRDIDYKSRWRTDEVYATEREALSALASHLERLEHNARCGLEAAMANTRKVRDALAALPDTETGTPGKSGADSRT